MGILHCLFDQIPHLFAFLTVVFLFYFCHLLVLPLVLRVNQAVLQVHFTKAFCLLPQVCFPDACKLETILKLLHCELFWPLNMLLSRKLKDDADVLCIAFLQPNKLQVCVNAVIPHLNGRAIIAFWSQYLPAFFLSMHSNFCLLFV